MKSDYYNIIDFTQACSYIESDPYRAKYLLEEYYRKYPKDYSARPRYAYVLIILNKLEEAKEYMRQLEQEIDENYDYLIRYNKYKYVENSMHLSYIRILAREKNYQELYHCLQRYPYLIDDSRVSFVCRYQMGIPISYEQRNGYMHRQIIDYQEEAFLEHIEKHTADYNMDLDNPNPCIFVPDFPLKSVVSEVKKYIPSDNKLCFGFFEDTYVFQYDGCGRDHNKLVDYFKVIAFNEEDPRLITMCPSTGCEPYPSVDLNYMIEKEKPKVKTLSQIEKFNQRYHR